MHDRAPSPIALPVTGVVLAGGRGVRVGGRDKGLIHWHGKPLVEHMLAQLAPQVARMLINANRNPDRYAAYGHPVVADAQADFPGPLAGMLAAMTACEDDWLLFVPCDSPWLPEDLASRLYQAVQGGGASAAYVVTPSTALYTHLLLHRRCRTALQAALASHNRSVRGFLQANAAVPVDFKEWTAPLDLNAMGRS
jgi:molybdopterin-guanine dinucleotide biosynthesis protein A